MLVLSKYGKFLMWAKFRVVVFSRRHPRVVAESFEDGAAYSDRSAVEIKDIPLRRILQTLKRLDNFPRVLFGHFAGICHFTQYKVFL